MRILLINHFPLEGSGSGIYTQNVADVLLKLGHEVMVIAPDHKQVTNKDFLVRSIIFSNGVNKNFHLPFNFPCFTTHPFSNTTFYELTDTQISDYTNTLLDFIYKAKEDFNPDIIHAQHLWISSYCAKKTGIPFCTTCHGTDLIGFRKGKRYRNMTIDAVKSASFIIAISNQVKKDILNLFDISDKKIKVISNGFNSDIFRIKEIDRQKLLNELGLPLEVGKVICFVGKLTHFKGVDVLIKAASIYEKVLDNVITLIVGYGELYDELVNLANEMGLKRFYFLGHHDQNVVSKIYNLADLAVVPSRGEAFGLVAIEALACGTPVIGTINGGPQDFLNEEVGALVKQDSPEDLAKKIIKEIKSDSKSKKGKLAAKYALENFSWRKNVKELIDIYKKVIK
ncbi:MAG: glycosyltransferase [Actinobacteria bacterium]|nr:glycosyltransferase [Actinomycetota bacterium]